MTEHERQCLLDRANRIIHRVHTTGDVNSFLRLVWEAEEFKGLRGEFKKMYAVGDKPGGVLDAARLVRALLSAAPLTDQKPPTFVGPPRSAEYLLYLLLPPKDQEAILGDLEERFRKSIVPKFGPFWAKVWYCGQVFGSIMPIVWVRVRRLATVGGLAKVAYDVYRRFVA